MSNLILVRLEMAFVSVQDRCTVCAECTIGSVIILDAPIVLLGERLKWKLVSVRLEIVLIMTQDKCTVYAEHIIGSEIVLVTPDGTPR
jgi:hypothetical protein